MENLRKKNEGHSSSPEQHKTDTQNLKKKWKLKEKLKNY
jgi:hypothetical protein